MISWFLVKSSPVDSVIGIVGNGNLVNFNSLWSVDFDCSEDSIGLILCPIGELVKSLLVGVVVAVVGVYCGLSLQEILKSHVVLVLRNVGSAELSDVIEVRDLFIGLNLRLKLVELTIVLDLDGVGTEEEHHCCEC